MLAGPAWIPYSFAVIMVSVSLYCASRLVAARLWDRKNHTDINISHVLMGVGMAGMLVPDRNLISSEWGEYIFGFAALWFFGRSVQFILRHGISGTDEDGVHNLSHYAIHLLMSGAMLYMYLVAPPGGLVDRGSAMAMAGGASSAQGSPIVSLFLVVLLFGSAVWQLDSLPRFAPAELRLVAAAQVVAMGAGGPPARALSPSADQKDSDSIRGSGPLLAPRLEVACHIAMCITMGYMLVLML